MFKFQILIPFYMGNSVVPLHHVFKFLFLTILRLFFLTLQACESLSDGLGKSAAVLVQNPLKKFQRGSGAGPALAAAVRAVPAAAIAPASACASAVHCALLGFRNRSVIKLIWF